MRSQPFIRKRRFPPELEGASAILAVASNRGVSVAASLSVSSLRPIGRTIRCKNRADDGTLAALPRRACRRRCRRSPARCPQRNVIRPAVGTDLDVMAAMMRQWISTSRTPLARIFAEGNFLRGGWSFAWVPQEHPPAINVSS